MLEPFLLRLDTIAVDPITEVFQFPPGEEGFLGVDFESGFPEACKYTIEFAKVIVKIAFGDDQEVVDVGSNEVESFKKFIHLFLKDVGRIAEAHGGSLVFEFAEWKYNGTVFLGLVIEFKMVVSHIEVKTGCILEPFKVHEHVVYVWDRIRSALDPFIQFSEIRDESYCSVFLRNDECWSCPLRAVNSFEYS